MDEKKTCSSTWNGYCHSGTVVIKSISLEKLRALSLVSPKLFGIEYVTQLENLS